MGVYKLLFVDDEENILKALKRIFSGQTNYQIFTTGDINEAMAVLENNPIHLVVSDEKMPKVSGADFLTFIRKKYPDTVRILLTGYADMNAVVKAVNRGEVYRFMTKPWNDDELRLTISKALEYGDLLRKNQRLSEELQTKNLELANWNTNLEKMVAERNLQLKRALTSLKGYTEIIEKNIKEVAKLVTSILGIYQGELARHMKGTAEIAERILKRLKLPKNIESNIMLAAYLHDIGLAGCEEGIYKKTFEYYSAEEKAFYLKHPQRGEGLLSNISKLEMIAQNIRSHHEDFNGKGFPDGSRGEMIPLGARIIRVASDFDAATVRQGLTESEAYDRIFKNKEITYDPQIVINLGENLRGRL